MKEPIAPNRKIAIELGLQQYKSSKSCVHGHISPRATVSRNCIECLNTIHRDKRSESVRRWQNDNKERKADTTSKRRAKTRSTARNSRQSLTQNQINIINKKNSNGDYVLSASRLAEIMGRSEQAIEQARSRYRIAHD